ncbi:McrB family protein [Eudoraea adriatica]|uniref:McrB family protein n=1 Tax=Eudoraea adriatica TaxID=446681 RepID=UPI0003747DE5|nr:AAA family ATPase [Eudoraea adriatica]
MSLEHLIEKSKTFNLDEVRWSNQGENSRQEFIKKFPLNSLKDLTVDNYVQGAGNKNSFCYWLEFKKILFGIGGGNAFKYGLWKATKDNNYYVGYGKNKKQLLGEELANYFNTIKKGIITALALVEKDQIEGIKDINIPIRNDVLQKIMSMYYPEKFIAMGSPKTILEFAHDIELKGVELQSGNVIQVNYESNKFLRSREEFKNWDYWKLGVFIWLYYNDELEEIKNYRKEFSAWLAQNFEISNGTSSSYIKALDILSKILKKELFTVTDNIFLNDLYEDLIAKQKEPNGRYFYKKSPSYGRKGFYSAAVSSYIQFLDTTPIHKDQEAFADILEKYSPDDLATYFSFLFEFLNKYQIKKRDTRLLYSTSNNNLAFTIGQRLSWVLHKSNKRGKFGVLSIDKIRSHSEEFSGNRPFPFFTYFNSIEFSKEDKESIFNGFEQELNRTNKSSYSKHTNKEFENAVFDRSFREKFTGIIKGDQPDISDMKQPVNTIFYGPPGTGKTFRLKQEYFDKYTSKETSISKEKHFEYVVENIGWHECLAIALLDLGRSTVSNIMEHPWILKKREYSQAKNIRANLWGNLQAHTVEECPNVHVKKRRDPSLFYKHEDSTWEVVEDQLRELIPEIFEVKKSVEEFNPDPDKEIKRYRFVTFHQSFSYEDFIEGIKPILPEDGEEVSDLNYTIEDGVFKELCRKAEADPENQYAIFIDEINRGNIAQIFGELITLIEKDKRWGADNQLSTLLPYSKKVFRVPKNLDIYGTMNTADRSVEALDTALRRRFSFEEVMPDPEKLIGKSVGGIDLKELLTVMNERIELLVDRDHTIGHSYFLEISNQQELVDAFNNKVIPLLQEYFYGDFGKIGLVLGKGFIQKKDNKKIKFADFQYENEDDFKNDTYTLVKITEDNISKALEILLRNKQSEVEEQTD